MSDQAGFLVIEDDEDDILLVKRAFSQAKILNPLMVVKSAEEGIAYFLGEGRYGNRSEFPLPMLVLLDLKLPGLGGFEFLKWIRAQPEIGRTRVVVLTSSNLMQDVNHAHDLGANSFLVKPVGFESFVQTCRALSGYWLWMDLPPEIQRVAKEPSGPSDASEDPVAPAPVLSSPTAPS